MKFIDEAVIHVQAGHGGAGARSFHREKFVPLGGPDGGNGGRGGSVIIIADRNNTTLLDFHFEPKVHAKDGAPGQDSNKDGRAGENLTIRLPLGTQIFKLAEGSDPKDPKLGELVIDLNEHGQEFIIAKGGRGGKGNNFFKTSTNRAPEHFQPGEPGEGGSYVLSLKLVADVGLIGFPNAGKSTLISRISSAKPKIADYPFTTLTPNLGVARGHGGVPFVVADIPGIIPGAHEGKGLGIKFLKHTERTKVLAHLIDPLHLDEHGNQVDPVEAYDIINHELKMFSENLSQRPQLIVLTKVDAIGNRSEVDSILEKFKQRGLQAVAISSASGEGLPDFLEAVHYLLKEAGNTPIPTETLETEPS